jgi:MoxR-like ATPase
MTVSSRTTARDLQWRFDTVARLAEAELGQTALRPLAAYVMPGPLWWAFNGALASRRGLSEAELLATDGKVGEVCDPSPTPGERAVVLIDEIDKADPDVPNDLLVPLGSLRFQVDDGPLVEATHPPLVIITTNEERDLPRAFVRRCVVHTLEQPRKERLLDIARAHARDGLDEAMFEMVYAEYVDVRQQRIDRHEPPPSVAEFLDVLAACRSLNILGGPNWPDVIRVLLDKAVAIPAEQAEANLV